MDEAASTGADTVGVACPYCLIMLDDGERARGGRTEVLDLAQVLARSVVGAEPLTRARPRLTRPRLRAPVALTCPEQARSSRRLERPK